MPLVQLEDEWPTLQCDTMSLEKQLLFLLTLADYTQHRCP